MSANNKISNLVSTQVPFFVRNDHANFVKFIEAYYEYLEQEGKVINRAKIIKDQHDVDQAVDIFAEKLYDYYLKLVPSGVVADKNIILKNAKDFYAARGTEKSISFLLNILFADSNTSFYYPKRDVLRASDGKWFIEKSLKLKDDVIYDEDDLPVTNETVTLQNFAGKKIYGSLSNATAIVETADVYYESGTLVKEFKISNQVRDFISGESIIANTIYEGSTYTLSANIISGIIVSTEIITGGNNYVVGSQVPIESNTGNNGIITISAVSSGSLLSVQVIEGGAGFVQGDSVVFTSSSGSGSDANVATVNFDGKTHPNSYNIVASTIELEANTAINNTKYSNLNSSLTNPANLWISNSMSYFTYANTGPATAIFLINTGTGYKSVPVANVSANIRVKQLGILGKMNIVAGGSGYANNELIHFVNGFGSYGTGALANIHSVNATGAIKEVRFKPVPGQITGGSGYELNQLPTANIVSNTGVGGIVEVTALLGYGDILNSSTDSIGKILGLRIDAGGSGYSYPPTLNLSSLGDGTAQATSQIVTGIFTYPGRYLNDDGHISGYNFIQDRDYYHNYSYVVKIKESIEKYRKALKDLVHPSGMKLFGEYTYLDDNILNEQGTSTANVTNQYIYYEGVEYSINNQANSLNTLSISMNTSGLSVNSELILQFVTGNVVNTGIINTRYKVKHVVNANNVVVYTSPYVPARANITLVYGASSLYNIYIDNRGERLFYMRSSSVMTFNMAIPYDISTLAYSSTTSVASQESAAKALTFSANGDFMYLGGEGNTIYQYALTQRWNVNTASVVANSNIRSISSNSISSLYAVAISNNGTMLYIGDQNSDVVFQFNLATPWYVNTATYMGQSSNTGVSGFDGLHFNANGTILYTAASSGGRTLRMYGLTEAWNVNTMSLITQSQNLHLLTNNTTLLSPSGLFVKPDGEVFYVSDRNGTNIVTQLPTTVTGNANNIIYEMNAIGLANVGKIVI